MCSLTFFQPEYLVVALTACVAAAAAVAVALSASTGGLFLYIKT